MKADRENFEAANQRSPRLPIAMVLGLQLLEDGPMAEVFKLVQGWNTASSEALCGVAATHLRSDDLALLHFTQAASLAKRDGDQILQARVLLNQAALDLRSTGGGQDLLDEALGLAEQLNLVPLQIDTLLMQATLHRIQWDLAAARRALDQARSLIGPGANLVRTLNVLEQTAAWDLQFYHAESSTRLLALVRAHPPSPSRLAFALIHVARGHMVMGRWEDAATIQEEALEAFTRIGSLHQTAYLRLMQAERLQLAGAAPEAIELARPGLTSEDGLHRWYALTTTGDAHLAQEQLGQAQQFFTEARQLASELNLNAKEALSLQRLCATARKQRDFVEASEWLLRARALDDGSHPAMVLALDEENAWLLLAQGNPLAAQCLAPLHTYAAFEPTSFWGQRLTKLKELLADES